ncbi:hypothetical protein HDU83_003593 [Entophlyctis luteolus]|nr:hypothetical protein HDU83_003593 [Entophlyctis luteolus]
MGTVAKYLPPSAYSAGLPVVATASSETVPTPLTNQGTIQPAVTSSVSASDVVLLDTTAITSKTLFTTATLATTLTAATTATQTMSLTGSYSDSNSTIAQLSSNAVPSSTIAIVASVLSVCFVAVIILLLPPVRRRLLESWGTTTPLPKEPPLTNDDVLIIPPVATGASGLAAGAISVPRDFTPPFPLDESATCVLHPFATEKHTLGECTTYRRLLGQQRHAELERALVEAESVTRRAEASALGFEFPVVLDGPCALHPTATGTHAHVLADCHTYRHLIHHARFADLAAAFASAAVLIKAAEPFIDPASSGSDASTPSPHAFPYILNLKAACPLHPTAAGHKRHLLGDCTTYTRLVAAHRFDEIEDRIRKAAEVVEAVKKVRFQSGSRLASVHVEVNVDDLNEDDDVISAAVASAAAAVAAGDNTGDKSIFSGDTSFGSVSGRGYDASIGTNAVSSAAPRPKQRRASLLKNTKVWWRNVSSSTSTSPPQRPAVGISRASPVNSVQAPPLQPLSRQSSRQSGVGAASAQKKRAVATPARSIASESDADGFVTAPEFSTSEGYKTAEEGKFSTSGGMRSDSEQYFTAQGEQSD